MRKLFTPDYYIHHYSALKIKYLKSHNITCLLCDIDNTLVAHDVKKPDESVLAFLKKIKDANIQLILISNNVEERVSLFCEDLHVLSYPFALKPLPKTFHKILKETKLPACRIAMLGDQLMTDMLGANVMGFHTILTAPIAGNDITFTKFNRFFETFVFWVLKHSKKLTKGEFDA